VEHKNVSHYEQGTLVGTDRPASARVSEAAINPRRSAFKSKRARSFVPRSSRVAFKRLITCACQGKESLAISPICDFRDVT